MRASTSGMLPQRMQSHPPVALETSLSAFGTAEKLPMKGFSWILSACLTLEATLFRAQSCTFTLSDVYYVHH